MDKVMNYLQQTKALYEKTKDSRSYNIFMQQLTGSHPAVMIIWRYTSWGQLEMNTYPALKDLYVKEFGQQAWDERTKFFNDNTVDISVYLRKYRADLSTSSK